MTLWHLAWMHATLWLILVGLVALPFTFHFAVSDTTERFQRKRFYWWAWVNNQKRLGFEACLYCGTECEGGPGCANRERIAEERRLAQ